MERLELKYQDAQKALSTLVDILKEVYSKIIRDATIQRFEYTFLMSEILTKMGTKI